MSGVRRVMADVPAAPRRIRAEAVSGNVEVGYTSRETAAPWNGRHQRAARQAAACSRSLACVPAIGVTPGSTALGSLAVMV